MRPIKLTMTAFGPYRDAETIDFTELGGQRLFVISGNTGAGKTSIFDAICFAIYGSASGEDRYDIRMLRSHYADDDTYTSVELDFAVGSRSYRVFRQMKHRKSGNKSETGEKSELYELVGDACEPIVDRFIATEVSAKLLSIVGLTKEQFGQIVMLPQGEFRKLLTSDTDNKEEILRRIFRTELFEKLEGRFQQQNRELQDALKSARADCFAIMRQAEEALPRREDGVLTATFQQESYNSSQVREGLMGEAAYYEEQAKGAAEAKAEWNKKLDESQEKLRNALAVNERFELLERMRGQLELCNEQEPAIQRQERELSLAGRAAAIRPYEDQANRAERASKEAEAELTRKRHELDSMKQRAEAAENEYKKEAAREEERRLAELELHRLGELLPVVESLAEQQSEVGRLQRQEIDASGKLRAAESGLQAVRKQRQQTQEAVANSEKAFVALPVKQERLRGLERQGKGVKRLLELDAEMLRNEELERTSSLQLEQLRRDYEQLEKNWVEGQASLLAQHLHDGESCPVCGSLQHPLKAASKANMPSKELLQERKQQLSVLETEFLGARAQTAAASSAASREKAELSESGLEERVAPGQTLDGQTLAKLQSELRSEWKKLKEECDQLAIAAKKLDEHRNTWSEQEKRAESLEAEKDSLRGELHNIQVERNALEHSLHKEMERIPEELRTASALRLRLASQSKRHDELQKRWQRAQEERQDCLTKLAELGAIAEQAALHAQGAAKDAEDRLEQFRMEWSQAGFASLEAYASAARTEDETRLLQEKIQNFRTSVAALKEQLAGLELELAGKLRTDTEALQIRLAQLREGLEAAIAAEQSSIARSLEAARLAESIARSSERESSLELKLGQVLDIYQMLKGDNALKISFERYILIEYLEQILAMANVRLKELSNGQFELVRSDRLEARGKQSGLGLDVYDAYTGQNRDVKSLSGGEKFNASLCLALGMTDVIQAHQGGISIEMMFIDEGFGSLDEESLQHAIAALIDLQRAGRMIGVISHVQELKEAFPACIEVSKTKEGFSRTAVIVK
ncbi:AAA family ATPase [Paenibacillus sp. HB172176]|uniref:AAA family ATPase n=1 Tax=Paenibacillus sp. HB172176 TaxID=2493690 RepID=UPI00143BC9C0|nr:AAA family ATPase [Paenibacillus sp. HB172176]